MLDKIASLWYFYPQFTNKELSSVTLNNLLLLTVGDKAGISIGMGALQSLSTGPYRLSKVWTSSCSPHIQAGSPQINATVRCVKFNPQTVEVWYFLNWGFHKNLNCKWNVRFGKAGAHKPIWQKSVGAGGHLCQRPVISVWVTPSCFP